MFSYVVLYLVCQITVETICVKSFFLNILIESFYTVLKWNTTIKLTSFLVVSFNQSTSWRCINDVDANSYTKGTVWVTC